jgi:exodeoxyribonuclease V beta subunit
MYTLGLHRYLSSRVNGYSFEKHFGGVLYLFARGVDSEKGTGIYRARPDLNTIDNLAAGLLGGTGI